MNWKTTLLPSKAQLLQGILFVLFLVFYVNVLGRFIGVISFSGWFSIFLEWGLFLALFPISVISVQFLYKSIQSSERME